MGNPDDRWRLRLQSYRKALKRLLTGVEQAQQRPLSDLEEQGLIQAFEFTHELSWNLLKDYLEAQGVQSVVGSRGAVRESFKNGLIVEGDTWMEMIQSRNQSSHTYDEGIAEEIVEAITSRYIREFSALEQRFTRLETDAP